MPDKEAKKDQDYKPVQEWLGLQLGLNSKDISLFIKEEFAAYIKQPRQLREKLADSVQFLDSARLKMLRSNIPDCESSQKFFDSSCVIVFGPQSTTYVGKTYENTGYTTGNFQAFMGRITPNS